MDGTAQRKLMYIPNGGEGNVTVVHQDSPDKYSVVATVTTVPGAKTITVDPTTHTRSISFSRSEVRRRLHRPMRRRHRPDARTWSARSNHRRLVRRYPALRVIGAPRAHRGSHDGRGPRGQDDRSSRLRTLSSQTAQLADRVRPTRSRAEPYAGRGARGRDAIGAAGLACRASASQSGSERRGRTGDAALGVRRYVPLEICRQTSAPGRGRECDDWPSPKPRPHALRRRSGRGRAPRLFHRRRRRAARDHRTGPQVTIATRARDAAQERFQTGAAPGSRRFRRASHWRRRRTTRSRRAVTSLPRARS